MPTLMTTQRFNELNSVRAAFIAETEGNYLPSNVFVPWAGSTMMQTRRGIYFVGIALAAEDAYGEQTFESRQSATERFVQSPDRGNKPFWRFVNQICIGLLAAPYDQTQDKWGWSNLLKIAGNEDSPDKWPRTLKSGQSAACQTALSEELAGLRGALVVILSSDLYGVVTPEITGLQWDKEDRPGCTYWLEPGKTGNAIVNCYHPNYLQRQKYFDDAVAETIHFSKKVLPPF